MRLFQRRRREPSTDWFRLPPAIFPEIADPISYRVFGDDSETITIGLLQNNRMHTFTVPRWAANRMDYLYNVVHAEAVKLDLREVGEDVS